MELMISIMIVSIITVIVFCALRLGTRSWEKGEQYIEKNQRYRVVLPMVERQLSSICLSRINDHGREAFFLNGNDKSIEFASNESIMHDDQDYVVYVKYQIVSESNEFEKLQSFEDKFILIEQKDNEVVTDEAKFFTLISGVHEIRFQYLKKNVKEHRFEWVDIWERKTEKAFPEAIKAIFTPSPDEIPVSIIAAIRSDLE